MKIHTVFVMFLISLNFIFSCDKNTKSSVPLLAEDQVRLSNDPEKTEIFRDAGLGLFIHWGPNSQIGSEISWPLYNASKDYIEKYYALAETFNPVNFKYVSSCFLCTGFSISTDFNSIITLFSTIISALKPISIVILSYISGISICLTQFNLCLCNS